MNFRHQPPCFVLLALALSACNQQQQSAAPPPPAPAASPAPATAQAPTVVKIEATPEAVKNADELLKTAADRNRRMRAALTFEEFKTTVYKEPFEHGKYIVNGDTPIANDKQLREFFEDKIQTRPATELILAQVSGMDAKWNQQQKRNLTYCVSKDFGSHFDDVVQQAASATGEWEKVAQVHFIHDATQDGNCGPANAAVVFDVRPVDVGGKYLARAFFPNEPRADRSLLVDQSSLSLPADEKLQLVGILRHELGHTIGFRHEHTRPDSGACFEDNDWRPLTSYDAFSVMHYPQCNGKGDWSLTLTDKDKNGAACVYGPTPPFSLDSSLVTDPAKCTTDQPAAAASGTPQTQAFTAQAVNQGEDKAYGPFPVAAGSLVKVAMGGASATGDPDLYVRFDRKPALKSYDCRPFVDGPAEVCSLTVPAKAAQVFVMVHGYAQGTYDLQVTSVPPSGTAPAAAGTGASR
jgi:serine protease